MRSGLIAPLDILIVKDGARLARPALSARLSRSQKLQSMNMCSAFASTQNSVTDFLYHFSGLNAGKKRYNSTSEVQQSEEYHANLRRRLLSLFPAWRSNGGLRRSWTGRRRSGPSAAPPSPNSTPSPKPSSLTSSATRAKSQRMAVSKHSAVLEHSTDGFSKTPPHNDPEFLCGQYPLSTKPAKLQTAMSTFAAYALHLLRGRM